MPYHLVTVDHVHKTGSRLGLHVAPTIPVFRLVAEDRSGIVPHAGEPVELRLPGGGVRHETIGGFGIDGTMRGRLIYTTSNPRDPEFTLYVAGDLEPGDVPSGTQIWLPDRESGPSAPPAGPCSYCQMKELRAQGLLPQAGGDMSMDPTHEPIEVMLCQTNTKIECRVTWQDEDSTNYGLRSSSLRSAKREIKAWLARDGYQPIDRWSAADADRHRIMRHFRRPPANDWLAPPAS